MNIFTRIQKGNHSFLSVFITQHFYTMYSDVMGLQDILRFICWARTFWQVLYIPAIWNLDLCVRFTIFLLQCKWRKLQFRPSPVPTRTVSWRGGGFLYTVIAYLCWPFYKCSVTDQKMWLLIQNDRNISEKSLWNRRAVEAVKRYEYSWIWLWKHTDP
jgi:hypothetical protein